MTELYTVDHPYVLAYIEYATAAMHEAEANSHDHGLAGCVDQRWHQLADHKQQTNWWRVEYGGVARPETVADALRPLRAGRPPFSIYEAERVLAVAALKVIDRPTHPAHWAFWARNARERVAHVVQEVVREKPKRIEIPLSAGWIDPDYNLYTLRMYQHGWLPLIRRPNGEHLRAAPPKRPAAVKTRTSARTGRKPAAKARAPAPSETNANGKRVAPTDEPVDVEAPAAKRQKRAPTAAASAAKGQSKPREKMATKASAASETSASPPTARETRARTRASAAAKQAESAPAPTPTIRIVPPSKAHALAAATATDAETAALVPEASGSVSYSAFREPDASLDASSTLSPLSSPPSTPSKSTPSSTSTSPTSKRPVGHCMPQRALSVAQSDCSELSLAPSATLTLVESIAPSDTCSTRAGTPMEVDVVGEKGKSKGKVGAAKSRTGTPHTPARTSARIQAKKGGSCSETSDSSPLVNRSWKKRRV